jgi:hypothetical protein
MPLTCLKKLAEDSQRLNQIVSTAQILPYLPGSFTSALRPSASLNGTPQNGFVSLSISSRNVTTLAWSFGSDKTSDNVPFTVR